MHYPVLTVLGFWILGFLVAESVHYAITKRQAPFFVDCAAALAFALIAAGFVA